MYIAIYPPVAPASQWSWVKPWRIIIGEFVMSISIFWRCVLGFGWREVHMDGAWTQSRWGFHMKHLVWSTLRPWGHKVMKEKNSTTKINVHPTGFTWGLLSLNMRLAMKHEHTLFKIYNRLKITRNSEVQCCCHSKVSCTTKLNSQAHISFQPTSYYSWIPLGVHLVDTGRAHSQLEKSLVGLIRRARQPELPWSNVSERLIPQIR